MDRRFFLKFGSLAAGSYAVYSCGVTKERVLARAKVAPGADNAESEEKTAGDEIYTAENPGPWAGKEASHLPKLTAADGRLTMITDHAMAAEHYISRHQLQNDKDQIIADKVIAADGKPESVFALAKPAGETINAYSTCNMHGVWKASFPIADLETGFIPVIFTAQNPGPWAGKEAGHLPAIAAATELPTGLLRVEVVTNHVMEQDHYICKQQIRDPQGSVLASNVLVQGVDTEAKSVFEIAAPNGGLSLFSTCNLHGIWQADMTFDQVAKVYTATAPGPTGDPAAHVPTAALLYDPNVLGRYDVVITNTHEMVAGTHFVYKYQVRSEEGALISSKDVDPTVTTTATATFNGNLFQGSVGIYHIYASCNLHGIWRNVYNFEQVNYVYTTTAGPNGGAPEGHIPMVTVNAETIDVATNHVMTPEHYIAKHQIRDASGKLVHEKNFLPTTLAPKSTFPKKGMSGQYNAFSFCNMHGIWKAALTV
ncbi:MAG: desulfoferrodoxin family protein [Oligoflexales bacterium]